MENWSDKHGFWHKMLHSDTVIVYNYGGPRTAIIINYNTGPRKDCCLFLVTDYFSLHSNGHFPGKPGLASYIGAKDDGSGGDKWSYKT